MSNDLSLPVNEPETLPPGLFTLSTLAQAVAQEQAPDVIDGLLPRKSVTVIVAPPGTAKTPFCLAAAMCVSAGIPFLGMATTRGPALYADGESAKRQLVQLGDALRAHHGMGEREQGPLIWSPNWEIGAAPDENRLVRFAELVARVKPAIAVIDTLRSTFPIAEGKNDVASEFMKRARLLANQHDLALMIVHHLRKPSRDPNSRVSLERDTLEWFNEASGAGAIISQADVRLGLAKPDNKNSNADLVLAGFSRGFGLIEPIYLAREYDENDVVKGYVRLSGADLLPPDTQSVYGKLGPTFFRRDLATAIGGNSESNVTRHLAHFRQAGLIVPGTARGQYQKVTPSVK